MSTAPANVAAKAMIKNFKVLRYYYVSDIEEKRPPFRGAHLALAKEYEHAGKLVLGGPLSAPLDGGIFIFQDLLQEEVEAYVKKDSYFQNNLIAKYDIRNWQASFGKWLNPLIEGDEA